MVIRRRKTVCQTATHLTFSADCERPVARPIESTEEVRRPYASNPGSRRCRRHLADPVYRIFLFGSRATGSAGERSDIDIGIGGPAPVPRSALAAIHDELEEARPFVLLRSSTSRASRRNSAEWRNSASRCDKVSIAASRFRARGHASGRGSCPPQGSDREGFRDQRF